MIVASVSSILLYTAWAGPEHGWGDRTGLTLLVGGLVLAVVFVLVELRATEPIIPMRLFRNSIFSLANALRLPDRHRDVRLDDLPAGLPAGGQRHVADAGRDWRCSR